jgi:two-component system cell cycle response regulator
VSRTIKLLTQTLTIDADVRNFISFVLESVNRLGGNAFSAAVASSELADTVLGGIINGRPLSVCLLLQGKQLLVVRDSRAQYDIATLPDVPPEKAIGQLCLYLENSTAAIDPEILLQRNAQMQRYFDETRARAEQEMETLQEALSVRQQKLLEVAHQAETDALTGLLNRRAFDERLKQQFLRAVRQRSSPLSLLFLDLDHFKQINDEFGHQAGDHYLNKTADILRKNIREDVDLVFRFGGDEFAVVLFADYPVACSKASQILVELDNKASIGIVTINQDTEDGLTLEQFIHRADAALYEAKRRGRGQVASHFCIAHSEHRCQFPCEAMIIR